MTDRKSLTAAVLVALALSLPAAAKRDRGGGGDGPSDCVAGRLGLAHALDGSLLLSFVASSQCETAAVRFELNGSQLGAPVKLELGVQKVEVPAPDELIKKGKNQACAELSVVADTGEVLGDRQCISFRGNEAQ